MTLSTGRAAARYVERETRDANMYMHKRGELNRLSHTHTEDDSANVSLSHTHTEDDSANVSLTHTHAEDDSANVSLSLTHTEDD